MSGVVRGAGALALGLLLIAIGGTPAVAQSPQRDSAAAHCATAATRYTLRNNQTFNGLLISNETDRYRLIFAKAKAAVIKVSPASLTRTLPTLLICDQAGQVFRQRSGEREEEIRLQLEPSDVAGKRLVLVLWNQGRAQTDYELAMLPAKPIDTTPKSIKVGDDDKRKMRAETALLSASGRPFARYSFVLDQPTRVRAFVSSDELDMRATLWSGTSKIAEDDNSGGRFNALLVRDLPAGPYLLYVESGGINEGEFKVQLSKASTRLAGAPIELKTDQTLDDQNLDSDSPTVDLTGPANGPIRQQALLAKGCAVALVGRPFALYKLVGDPGQVVDVSVESTSSGSGCPLLTEVGVDSPQGFIGFRQTVGETIPGLDFDKQGAFFVRVSADDPSSRKFRIITRTKPM